MQAQCSAPPNPIVAENCLPGTDDSLWDINTAGKPDNGLIGDPTIQGFATDISVNVGGTVYFKINTTAKAYTIDIYRMGYYQGNGARKVTSITPSVTLPQTQPACVTDTSTGLYDCGNWAVSASWNVPSTAVSGIYFAHLIRTDTGGDSHIVFIVRNDSSTSDVLFQTGDESWQAYNYYGGGSLYGPNSATFDLTQRAYKVSYNRPFYTRGFQEESASWVFGAEYPMVRWLEANGYNVTYFTGIDAARNGSLIKNHKVYLTSGHDEYWSGPHRTNVQAARDAGVNMAFFSGNEVFWKTRWENSIDGTNTAYRTLVCYKETLAFAKTDPDDPPTWTGTWRDPSFSPPADGGQPENALTGTLFMVNGTGTDNPGTLAITVPAADGQMRFWRNTAVAKLASGASYTLPASTLGYEWDVDADNGSRPAGAFHLSTSTYSLTTDFLLDWGATYGAGTATHHLMMYRAKSGALVFGAGTVQWSWGLDDNHDDPFAEPSSPDVNMQQATVNLLADMGLQPTTLQSGLSSATQSTDKTAPASIITSPSSGANLPVATAVTITGTATDAGGGVVGGVEVSIDGGNTWHPATGRGSWSYTVVPTVVGSTNIMSRSVDDSGNLENPSSGVTVTVTEHDCPCETWAPSATPATVDSGDAGSVNLGVKFRTDYNGYITGIRFYKGSANTGTHVGNLWSSTGTLLGSATFTNETSSGWQQVTFSTPIAITANTVYVASYFAPVGHYAADSNYFLMSGQDDPPVHLLADGVSGSNGVFAYGASPVFPNQSYNSSNYWVDVVFVPNAGMTDAPPALLLTRSNLSFAAYVGAAAPQGQPVTVINEGSGNLNWSASASASWIVLSPSSGTTPQSFSVSVNAAGLSAGTYTGTITVSASGATNPPQTISVSLTVTNLLLSSVFASQGTQGWVLSPLGLASNWSIVNQALQYSGSGNSQVFAGNSAWTNYTMTATFKLSSLLDWPGGIRGRVNPSTGAGYMVWAYPALGEIILFRASAWDINQPLTQLGQATATFDTVNTHNLSLLFSGSQIEVLYDGNVLITVTDSTYTAGLVALEGDSQVINFEQVLVTSGTANSGSIATGTNTLNFSANYGAANPAAQTVAVSATGSGTLAWTATSSAPWLTVSPGSGTTPANLQVSANLGSLTPGTYTGTIAVSSLGAVNLTQQITVNFTVIALPPAIVPSPTALVFTAVAGQPAPAAQTLTIADGGYGSFSWTTSSNSNWLTATPSSGSTPGVVSVSVNPSAVSVGSYSGSISIAASGVGNSPLAVPVSLEVLSQDMNENFSDLGNGWIISPMGQSAGWTVSNAIYSYSGQGLSQSCTGDAGWSDYTFDASVKLSSLSNWPGGVRARVNPSTGAGYLVWLYPANGTAILYKTGQWSVNGSILTQLAQASVSFETTKFHDLRMAFQGSTISVSWDGNSLMSASDATYSSGFVCLDANNQPISYSNIEVAAVQKQVALDPLSPSSIVFNALPGATAASQTLNITAGGASTAWAFTSSSPSWMTVTASGTLTPGTITIAANAAGLSEGTYNATITIYAPGASNSPLTIPVTLAVKTAVLSITPASLTFFGATTVNPLAQQIRVANAGTGTLRWSATETSSWLGLSPNSGSAPGTISVQPTTTSLSNGSYTDTVTVSSPDVSNSPGTVPVSLQVGTLLFSDNFSSGAGNWTIGPLGNASGWTVSNGSYSFNGEGATQSWAGNELWTNYTVSANFQLSNLNDWPGGIRGRLNTSTGASYGVWVYPAQGYLILYRIGQWDINASTTQLAQSAPVTIDTNVHNLRMVFQGSTIQVYYDNALVMTATDSNYMQGSIALDVSNQPISFSNVQVIGF